MKLKKVICAVAAAMTCLFLIACTPTSVSKAKEKMREEGYTVSAYSADDAEDVEGGFVAMKSGGILNVDTITAVLFKSTKAAKKFMEESGDKLNAIRDGKWVYWGTEDAIEDFKD